MANLTPLLTLLPLPNPPVFPYLPASEQPAQRLMDASAEALSDGELLSLVLATRRPNSHWACRAGCWPCSAVCGSWPRCHWLNF
jgi:hypothetical protein